MFRLRAIALSTALLGVALPAAADDAASPSAVEWRPYSREAFREAERRHVPVFLWLTAPWNRDHFQLPQKLFADTAVVRALDERAVPVRADATLYPELRPLYRIASGLLPSLHFLDSDARPRLSVPPVEPSELLLFLSESVREAPPATEPEPRESWELNARKLTSRIALQLVSGFRPGGYDLAPTHADLDPSPLEFLLEYLVSFPQRRELYKPLRRELADLVGSPLYDRVDGGFHRAIADPTLGIPHFEKLLRPNAELASAFGTWFRLTQEKGAGVVSARTVRLLNQRFRAGDRTLYAGSLAADVYGTSPGTILLHGSDYYSLEPDSRSRYDGPAHSDEIPVGANFTVVQSLVRLTHVFDDEKLMTAVKAAGEALLDEGFLRDGAARRALGLDAPGNLRDQGEAGCGLLAYHAVTGDPRALEAAERVAKVLERDFWDDDRAVFRNVSRHADLPDLVRDAEPEPGWNGIALRFVLELDAVTGGTRWKDRADHCLDAWADRIPVDGRGIAELGRAAIRAEYRLPVLVIFGDPGTPEVEAASALAARFFDPLALTRWIPAGRKRDAADLGIRDAEPGLYLVWDETSPPLGDGSALEEWWDAARRRIRR